MSILAVLDDPKRMTRIHGWLAIAWIVLTLATTAWAWAVEHNPLMAWVIAMSGYANACGHWAARQGAAPSAPEGSV